MKRVKIFNYNSTEYLEGDINKWLEDNPVITHLDMRIGCFKISEFQNSNVVLIIYDKD